MKISFLGSTYGTPAVKTFTSDGVQAYPQIRNFNSKTYELKNSFSGLKKKVELLRKHAACGDCTLKGYLNEDLENESRAGKVNREAMTNNLILDIDGVQIPHLDVSPPLDKEDITDLAEQVVQHLPEAFHGRSYIVHASSSMGMKENRICLHLDFMLDEPVVPQALKEYVVHLNHNIPLFERNFSLSASGTALRFPLDKSVVDNSHLIFLGTPVFKDKIANPIPNDDDRIFLVEKGQHAVALSNEIKENCNTAKTRRLNDRKINELRDLEGLPRRKTKTSSVTVGNQQLHVVLNPERASMQFAADNGNWVSYNVNGGDSGGYYVAKYNPAVVRNFKGEPNFLFEQADPETYQWHLDTFIGTAPDTPAMGKPTPPMPLVFRDMQSNVYYNALIDASTGGIQTIAKSDHTALEDFMSQHGGVMPETVPTWDYVFDPHSDEVLSYSKKFINKYTPSPFMVAAKELPGNMVPLEPATALQLSQYCPVICELLLHVIGRDTQLFEYFLNWLASALQMRDKLGTAWIIQGTQGTGKGLLFDNILVPLVGHGTTSALPYATKIRIENLEDSFNLWQECALFIAFDEFRLDDSINGRKLFNKIKGMITEKQEPIRGMRENLRTVRSYANYFIFSNDQDVITIPPDDRRFNVAPRQEIKLSHVFSDLDYIIHVAIPGELRDFACAMMHFKVDRAMAMSAVENEAKTLMRQVSQTSIDDFVTALATGDLEFFLPVLDMPIHGNAGYVLGAQSIIKTHLRDMDHQNAMRITIEELRIIYCALISSKVENAIKFSKLMGRHGLQARKMRIHQTVQRGYEICWFLNSNKLDALQKVYLSEIDHDFAPNTNVVPLTNH